MARVLTPMDIHSLMNGLVEQATGSSNLTVVDSSSFVSAGETVLATGVENTLNALGIVLGRRVIAVRPYKAKLAIINAIDSNGYTTRLEKISFYEKPAQAAGDWNTNLYTNLAQGYDNGSNNGASVASMWEQNQAVPFTLQFGGSSVWDESITTYEDQVKIAFRDEDTFTRFIAGIMTKKANDIEKTKEAFNRMNLLNKIAATVAQAAYLNGAAVDLTAAFNADQGTSYTRADLLGAHLTEFLQFFTATFKDYSDKMTYDTIKYHWDAPKTVGLDTLHVTRHTDKVDQRAILYGPLFKRAQAMVFSEIFNPEYLEDGSQHELVEFWQAFNAGPAISVTPAVTDMDSTSATYGTQIQGSTVALDYVVGVLYDRDALMTDFGFEGANTTPVEARKKYRNTFWHFSKNAVNDPSENFIVFYLG